MIGRVGEVLAVMNDVVCRRHANTPTPPECYAIDNKWVTGFVSQNQSPTVERFLACHRDSVKVLSYSFEL